MIVAAGAAATAIAAGGAGSQSLVPAEPTVPAEPAVPAKPAVLARPIPSTGERVPVVGLGTWQTFDVVPARERAARGTLLAALLDAGGTLVDSSPMYGEAEAVIGEGLRQPVPGKVFAATKVWTIGRQWGVDQMNRSMKLWGLSRIDLMQVHNLLDWRTHLQTLQAWKAEGRVRYVGVTTSHGRRHDELERIMRREPLDFVQFTYSLADRDADKRLLPLAAERGIAVIANRPFDGGALFDAVKGRALPGWAAEIGCANWAQAFLKFIVSHPAVTCAIPATSQRAHLHENVGALAGPLPDAVLRARIARDFDRG